MHKAPRERSVFVILAVFTKSVESTERRKMTGDIRKEKHPVTGRDVIYIETPVGEIQIQLNVWGKDYPGVCVDLTGPKVASNGVLNEVPLAIVEYNPEEKGFSTMVWEDTLSEDYTQKIIHKNYLQNHAL